MYITNDPKIAEIVQDCGVKRVWVDVEKLGKAERQAHINSVKSDHTLEDIKKIRPFINKSELLVRINPINQNSREEIEHVIDYGADMIMLPMFKSEEEVDLFVEYVGKKVKTTLLFETKESIQILDKVLKKYDGFIDEIHVGLNDLHLSYGMQFMFELLSNGLVEKVCKQVKKYNIPYGFGGIAKIGEGLLPAERIIAEHFRLGSSRAILSRSFCDNHIHNGNVKDWEEEFRSGIEQIRSFEKSLLDRSDEYFVKNCTEVKNIVEQVCSKRL